MRQTATHIDELAASAAARFGLADAPPPVLCNVAENHTFRIGDRYALRLHRPGYRTAAQIESELAWIDALRDERVVPVPRAVPAPDGRRVIELPGSRPRYAVLFEWLDGTAPNLEAAGQFETLGAISARMHDHARRWGPPPAFARPRWDYDSTVGAQGHWGRWQDGLGVGPEERRQLDRAQARIAARLEAFGQAPHRFGLVHADIRLANLLVDEATVRVIDFDDCGFSWFMYDFATAVSFIEDHPRVPELREAWLRGYRSVSELPAEDEGEIDTFVMLRRLLLVAWIGSHHAFAPEAARLGAGFTAGTCALAERYLSCGASRRANSRMAGL